MRRIAIALTLLALLAGVHACTSDAPGPTTPDGGGNPPTGTSALQIRIFTSNPNPPAGSCTLIQAIVTLRGTSVADGTGVSFSSNFGVFQENLLNVVSVVTQNGAAVTALCSEDPGTANARAQASSGGQSGSATITIAFQPVAGSGPFVSFCSPGFGPASGGTTLVINGGRFFGTEATTRVTFVAAGVSREALVTDVTESEVTVVTPSFPEAISPTVPVEIRLVLGATTASPLTLTLPNCFAFGNFPSTQPSITAVLPSSGTNEGNTRVTILGSGFQAPMQVFFGDTEAQVLSVSFNQIVALTPAAFGAGRNNLNATVDVRVRNAVSGAEATLGGGFRYVTAVQLTSISNNQQRVNAGFTPVTIYGQGFQAPVAVELAGIAAAVLSVSATELLVLPGRPFVGGCSDVTGPVSVTNINSGDSASGLSFRYLVEQTKPFISFVSPSSGGIGAPVTITGGNFTGVTSVRFGSRPATFSVVNDGTIGAAAPDSGVVSPPACPAGIASGTLTGVGTVAVTVENATTGCSGTLGDAFTYVLPCVTPTPTPTSTPTRTPTP